MNLRTRLKELSRLAKAPTPVVSVYLNTDWSDERQRDRVRIFLKNEIAHARQARNGRAAEADLDWVETQGLALVNQATVPAAAGIALFACEGLALREVLAVFAPFENVFVVADTVFLRPLVVAAEELRSALVVFIDARQARLVPFGPEGPGEEVRLEEVVPEHARRSGWAQMTQARYEAHMRDHRQRHFEAVAETLIGLVENAGTERIVLSGEPGNIALLRRHLPHRIDRRIIGTVAGAHYEATDVIVARAAELLPHAAGQREAAGIEAALTAAAKGGRAAAGLKATLDAVNRGAVRHLYVSKTLHAPGSVCSGCRLLDERRAGTCRMCGKATQEVELVEAMIARTLAAGASVDTVENSETLIAAGGVAAELRYPLTTGG